MTPRQIYFINLARKKKSSTGRVTAKPGTSKASMYVADKMASQ